MVIGNKIRQSKLVPPMSLWPGIVGLVVFILSYLVEPEPFARTWVVISSILSVLCLFLLPRFPVPVWAFYVVLFGYIMSHPVIGVPALSVVPLALSAMIAARGYTVATIIGAALLWLGGSVDWSAPYLLPPNWVDPIFWGIVITLPVLVGFAVYRSGWKQKVLKEQWDSDVQTRRETMGRMLHDSVASSLTSLIMRLEALSLQQDISKTTRDELVDLAEQARLSMKEVRDLLHTLSTDDSPRGNLPAPSVMAQLQATTSRLKEHGFAVKVTGHVPNMRLNADQLVILREVFRELSTNIIKYGEPNSTVTINFGDRNDKVLVSISNVINLKNHSSLLSSGMGVPALSQMMETIGGSISTITTSTEWKTELEIPRDSQE